MSEVFEADGRPLKVVKDRYEVVRRIGKGSYGTVYACRDYYLGNAIVAMKVFPPHVLRDRLAARRLAREIQAANRVDHENVVRFYDFFKYSDFCAITMEFVDGPSLRAYMEQSGVLSYEVIIDIGRQICQGLQAIHNHTIIHRDLKPDNILIAHGSLVKITDFGIAALTEAECINVPRWDGKSSSTSGSSSSKGQPGIHVMGTGRYISPESAEFNYYDQRSDLYAFGVILYEMITGRFFFEYKGFHELMKLKIENDAPPPQQFRADCPELLSRVCIKALQRNPDNRYQDTLEVLDDLRAARKSEGMQAAIPVEQADEEPRGAAPPGKPAAAFWRRLALSHRALWYLAAFLLLAVIVSIAARLSGSSSHPRGRDVFEEAPAADYRITVSVGAGSAQP